MTFSILDIIVAISIKDAQHDTWHKHKVHYPECCILFIDMLNVVVLSVVMLSVVAPMDILTQGVPHW